MGVLTDLVVVPSARAQEVCDAVNPSEAFGGVDAKGLDQIKLSTLWALIEDREWNEEDVAAFDLLCSASEEGPWVTLVPDALVAKLAELPDEALDDLARRWGETEELELDRWDGSHAVAMIGELRRLARLARDRREALMMWMSL